MGASKGHLPLDLGIIYQYIYVIINYIIIIIHCVRKVYMYNVYLYKRSSEATISNRQVGKSSIIRNSATFINTFQ